MADGDRAAVDVDLGGIPTEVLVDGAGLRGKRLIGLDQVEIGDIPTRLLERRARGRDRAGPHDRRVDARVRPGDDAGERRLAALGRFAGLHQHQGRGAVVDARGIAGGHAAVLGEGRPQLGDRLEGGAVLGIFVGIDHDIALARLHRNGRDLVLEFSRLLGRLGLVLRCNGELVLLRARDLILLRNILGGVAHVVTVERIPQAIHTHLDVYKRQVLAGDGEPVLILAGDLPARGDVLGGVAHVIAVEGVPQAVLDHGVDHVEIAHFDTCAQMGAVRGLAHGLLAAGDHDLGIAIEDRLVAERDRPQPGAAELVHAPRRALDRDARGDRRLARRVLPLPCREDLAEDHFRDLATLDASALERLFDGRLAQFVGRQVRERAVEGPDRRAGRADDDDIVLHFMTPCCIPADIIRLDGTAPRNMPRNGSRSAACGIPSTPA